MKYFSPDKTVWALLFFTKVVSIIKKLLVGNTISAKCQNSLEKMGYTVIKMPCFDRLQKGVSTHIDMLLFYNGETIVTHRDYYKENREIFDKIGVKVITTDETISEKYPNDILFNAVLTDEKLLFSKSEYTSEIIKSMAKEIFDVKQGYTACSTCKVASNAFITTDTGLHKTYTSKGIDCLLIESKGIYLPGYDVGFIGGATAILDENVCFFGNIEKHKDYERIVKFVHKYGKNIVSLSDEDLTDIGGCVLVL